MPALPVAGDLEGVWRGMRALPAVGRRHDDSGAEVCLHCGTAVDPATAFVCIPIAGHGDAPSGVRDKMGAVLHGACHPAWWQARLAAARALGAGRAA